MGEASGQSATQEAGAMAQSAVQAGQQALQQKQVASQQAITGLEQGVQSRDLQRNQQVFQAEQAARKFANDLGNKLERMSIDQEKFSSDVGLAWLVTQGASQRELDQYVRDSEIADQREMQAIEQQYRLAAAAREYASKKGILAANAQLSQQLLAEETKWKEEMSRKQAERANKAQIASTVLGIGGAIAGSFAGPGGAAVGFQVGSGVGSAFGGNV
jgi:hypothetical protein